MKFLKPGRRSLNHSSLLPNENCALIFCLFEEAGCSLHRPRSSEEHGGVASRALVVIPNWTKHQNHKSSGYGDWGWYPFAKMGYLNTVIPFLLSFWHSKSPCLLLSAFSLKAHSPRLYFPLCHEVSEITVSLPNLIISFGAFLAHPFHDLTYLAENAQRSWCLPNHVYMRCFLSPFLPCFGRP